MYIIYDNILYSLSCTLVTTVSVNECAEGTDNCAQVCTDTDLSYTCSCRSGYRLASNGHGCDGKAIKYMHVKYFMPTCIPCLNIQCNSHAV